METAFTPLAALSGGVLIGLSAVFLMATLGRIAGMTAIFAGIFAPLDPDNRWRLYFLGGAIAAPMIGKALGGTFQFGVPVSDAMMAVGGVIVGVGVTYGAGCASGHGVCGMARLSRRSVAATAVFMLFSVITVTLIRHVL